MDKKAIIFDLDGVLVYTDVYHYQAWKQIADEKNIYFDKTINNRLRGVSREESLEIILEQTDKKYTQEEKQNMLKEKNIRYRELLNKMSEKDVTKEVRLTLTYLKELGIKLAIGSSSKNAKFILKKVELLDYFDAISDGTNIVKGKPEPEVFLKAAKFLDIKPEACMVVEDAVSGVEAAKRANMLAIGIGDAVHCEKTDVRLKQFEDLVTVINTL